MYLTSVSPKTGEPPAIGIRISYTCDIKKIRDSSIAAFPELLPIQQRRHSKPPWKFDSSQPTRCPLLVEITKAIPTTLISSSAKMAISSADPASYRPSELAMHFHIANLVP